MPRSIAAASDSVALAGQRDGSGDERFGVRLGEDAVLPERRRLVLERDPRRVADEAVVVLEKRIDALGDFRRGRLLAVKLFDRPSQRAQVGEPGLTQVGRRRLIQLPT